MDAMRKRQKREPVTAQAGSEGETSGTAQSSIKRALARFDTYQQTHPWLAFPIAVGKKFGNDQAGYLAALVAYYAFFSLFPLLLILVSVLGFLLGRNSQFQQRVLDSVLAQIPIIGNQIGQNISSIKGSGFALIIGVAGTLLAGMGVIQALQYGMNEIWNVPFDQRPKMLAKKAQALLMLGVLGMGALISTLLAGLGGSQKGVWSVGLRVAGVGGALVLNLGLFMVAFRVLSSAMIRWRDVFPGAAVAAVGWSILQAVGGYIVRNQLTRASQVYGLFAIVIGLLSWFYIGSQLTLLAAEINVVKARHLWPRNLDFDARVTRAERRALSGLAKQEHRHPRQQIDVEFEPHP